MGAYLQWFLETGAGGTCQTFYLSFSVGRLICPPCWCQTSQTPSSLVHMSGTHDIAAGGDMHHPWNGIHVLYPGQRRDSGPAVSAD